jgi:hypothetical protein
MPPESYEIRTARALGVAQGRLDSIITVSESAAKTLTDVTQLKERLAEIQTLAIGALARIATLVPDSASDRDKNVVRLSCEHYIAKPADFRLANNTSYTCPICRRSRYVHQSMFADSDD